MIEIKHNTDPDRVPPEAEQVIRNLKGRIAKYRIGTRWFVACTHKRIAIPPARQVQTGRC